MTQTVPATDVVTCPFCGSSVIRGSDECPNCGRELAGMDIPATYDQTAPSDFNTPISTVRLSKPTFVAAGTIVKDAVAAVAGDAYGAAVVMDGERPVGIFTERDVLKRLASHPDLMEQKVDAFMTKDPVMLREDDTMATALNKMGNGGFRHIPLVRDGEVVAIVTARDILQWVMSCYLDS